jgi:hypothetical protein
MGAGGFGGRGAARMLPSAKSYLDMLQDTSGHALPQRGDDVAGACRPYLKTRWPRMRWWSMRSLMIR